jgi:predicted RNA binding protein YcfA (HicA-like mRNA interferase family)
VSQRFPALKPKDVLRLLQREGFVVHHISGSHYVLKHPDKKHLRVTLPWHGRELKRGTLGSVIQQAGYTNSEFLELLKT